MATKTFGSILSDQIVDNVVASTDPTVNDDSSSGYRAGSLWINTDGKFWVCEDASVGAAVWTQYGSSGAATSEKSWAFSSPSGSSGTFYIGGYYEFAANDDDFNPSINFGSSNDSYAAHVFFVAAAGGSGGTDTVIRVTGTSITDTGTRTASDTEDVTLDDAGSAGAYYETSKKWIGLNSIEKISGPDLLCNYGWCKYWDNSNSDFTVTGCEATWLGGANDASPDIRIRHHKATGWTYNAGSTPTPPTAIASMSGDHAPEDEVSNGDYGAWKRTNLNTAVSGSGSEGTIIEIVTSANRTFEEGNFIMTIKA